MFLHQCSRCPFETAVLSSTMSYISRFPVLGTEGGDQDDSSESAVDPNTVLKPGGDINSAPAASRPSVDSEKEKAWEPITINPDDLQSYVGTPPFTSDRIYDRTPAGVVMGLAWTAMGGSTLYIEAAVVEQGDGKGSLKATG